MVLCEMRYNILFGLAVLLAVDAGSSTSTSKGFLDTVIDWLKGNEAKPNAALDNVVSSVKDDSLQDGLASMNTLLGSLLNKGLPSGGSKSLGKVQDRSDTGATMSSAFQTLMDGLSGQSKPADDAMTSKSMLGEQQTDGSSGINSFNSLISQNNAPSGMDLKPLLGLLGGQSNAQVGMNYLQSLLGGLGGQGNGQAGMDLQSLLGGLGGQSNGPTGMDFQTLLNNLGGQGNGFSGNNPLQSLLGGLGSQSNGLAGMDFQSLLNSLGGQSNGPAGIDFQSLLSSLGGQGNGLSGNNPLQSLLGGPGSQSNGLAGMDFQSLLSSLGGQSNGPAGMNLQSLLGGLGGQSNGPGGMNLQSLMSGLLGKSNPSTGLDLQSLLGSLGGQSSGPSGMNLQSLLGGLGGQDRSSGPAGMDMQSLLGGLVAQDRSANILPDGMNLLPWLSDTLLGKDSLPSSDNPDMRQSMSLVNPEYANKLTNNDLTLLLDAFDTLSAQPSVATDRSEGSSEASDLPKETLVATDRSTGFFDSFLNMLGLGDDDDDHSGDETSIKNNKINYPNTGGKDLQQALLGALANSVKNKQATGKSDINSLFSSMVNTIKTPNNDNTNYKSLYNLFVGDKDRNVQNEPGQVQVPVTLLSKLFAGDKSPNTLAMVKQALSAQSPAAFDSDQSFSHGFGTTVDMGDKSLASASGRMDRNAQSSVGPGGLFSALSKQQNSGNTMSNELFGGMLSSLMGGGPLNPMGMGGAVPSSVNPLMGMGVGGMQPHLNAMMPQLPMQEKPAEDKAPSIDLSDLTSEERLNYYGKGDEEEEDIGWPFSPPKKEKIFSFSTFEK